MTAASADVNTSYSPAATARFPVAASKIYGGTIVVTNAAGYLEAGADVTAKVFAGIAIEQYDNSAGSAGDLTAVVHTRGSFQLTTGETLTVADVGKKVYITDDQTFAFVGTTTNDVYIGKIEEFISANEAIISIDEAAKAGI